MPPSVAFFRNLNLGQRNSPTRAQLLAAVADAGGAAAWSFQGNGTVVLEAADPQAVADEAATRLTPLCGYDDVAIVRDLGWLRGLGLEALGGDVELTVFDGPDPFPEPLPWVPERGDVTVLRADARHALVLNHLARRSAGTRVVEHRLGVRATSRGTGTVLRLLAKQSRTPEERDA